MFEPILFLPISVGYDSASRCSKAIGLPAPFISVVVLGINIDSRARVQEGVRRRITTRDMGGRDEGRSKRTNKRRIITRRKKVKKKLSNQGGVLA